MEKEIMTEENEASELADDIFRHELKASEKMGELFTKHEAEEAEKQLIASFVAVASKIDDPERLQRLVRLAEGVGQRLGSERMVEKAYEVAEKSEILEVEEGA